MYMYKINVMIHLQRYPCLSFTHVGEFVSFCETAETETLWGRVWSGLFTQDQMSLSSHHAASKIILIFDEMIFIFF